MFYKTPSQGAASFLVAALDPLLQGMVQAPQESNLTANAFQTIPVHI